MPTFSVIKHKYSKNWHVEIIIGLIYNKNPLKVYSSVIFYVILFV